MGRGEVLHIYLYWLSLILGWVPLFIVDIRRRGRPNRLDIGILILSYPIIFLAIFAYDRLYFR